MPKRYSIVRVDGFCPLKLERKLNCDNRLCKDCKLVKNYGDTKEQLEQKVAQVIFRRKLRLYKEIVGGTPLSTERKHYYKKSLEQAKEIVEFLGVEDEN